MELAEIRELDGPNIFLAEPAIKIEFVFDNEADVARARQRAESGLRAAGIPLPRETGILHELLTAALAHLSERHAQPAPATVWKTLDTPGHIVFAFGWTSRGFARSAAQALVNLLQNEVDEPWLNGDFPGPDDLDERPLWIRDGERRARIVAITGTNGKTTTTRLVAHMAMSAGFHAGWSSSSGVYIDGVEVLEGDYSGPSGARRVLLDPVVDVAVLESARGGILLRGLAFEHCDVSVFTNVSPDHLGLQGINTLDSLANVKAVVVKTTRPQGVAVLNADDKHVMRGPPQFPSGNCWFLNKSRIRLSRHMSKREATRLSCAAASLCGSPASGSREFSPSRTRRSPSTATRAIWWKTRCARQQRASV